MMQQFTRLDVTFKSHETKCAAWLYLPVSVDKPPLVIMAHGTGGNALFGFPHLKNTLPIREKRACSSIIGILGTAKASLET